MSARRTPSRRPSPLVSAVVFAAAVGLMGYLRLVVYPHTVITLSYGLPLLICLWHRDRRLLWAMTAALSALGTYKAFFLIPALNPAQTFVVSQWAMQMANTLVVAATVDIILRLIDRLRAQNADLEQANEELAAREEEIGRQNEELQSQSEELARQNEELQQQGEELQSQTEELQAANTELKRREDMMQTILQSLRAAEGEKAGLDAMCAATLELFEHEAAAVALTARAEDRVRVLARAGAAAEGPTPAAGSFAAVVMDEGRTAFVEDLALRPDLSVLSGQAGPFRSVLAAPVRAGGAAVGAVEIYASAPRAWTVEHFRVVEWVAAQFSMILEIRRLHEQLLRANAGLETLVQSRTAELQRAMAELEHFSYSITHDMRAPLRAMLGYAELLNTDALPEGERKNFLSRIVRAAGRMDKLITDALSYSKAGLGEMALTPVDPGKLIMSMIESYPALQPPRADIRVEGELPPVLANEAGLTQCFSNLLNNAVKFVEKGRAPRVRVRAERGRGVVRLWFEDNGIGVPEEMRSRIFGMFQRASAEFEGTGIGLALVKKVAERMGGRVGLVPSETTGSRFWLELKAAAEEAT